MRLGSLLKLGLVVVVILVVALTWVVKSINMDDYKTFVIAQVKAATGRDMTIGGPLQLSIGLVPKVVADGITLSNMSGGSRPQMVTVERVEAEVALLPLLAREIRIRRLIVSGPDIVLETDKTGQGNWRFGGGSAVQSDNDAPETRLFLREVRVKNGRVRWRDGQSGQVVDLSLHKLAIQPEQGGAGPLSVQIVGDYQQTSFDLSGTVGAVSALSAGKPWPIRLKAAMGGMVLVADGTMADPLALHGLDLKLSAQGDEIQDAARLAGQDVGPLRGPFKVAARLTDPQGRLSLADVDLAVGRRDGVLIGAKGAVRDPLIPAGIDLLVSVDSDSLVPVFGDSLAVLGAVKLTGSLAGGRDAIRLYDIRSTLAGTEVTGDLSLSLKGPRPKVTGKLAAQSLALGAADVPPPTAQPGKVPAKTPPRRPAAVADGRVFPDILWPVASLKMADVQLDVAATTLGLGGLHLSDVAVHLGLDRGRLAVKPLTASLADGRIDGDVMLDVSGRTPQLAVRLSGDGINAGRLLKDAGNPMLSGGKSQFRLDIHGQGPGLRAALASANGSALVVGGGGQLHNRAVDWAGGDILTQLAGALNPLARQDETTELKCAVARFAVTNGVANAAKGIAVETGKVNVLGGGTVDLRNEALDMGVSVKARDGLGISLGGQVSGLTRLRGTLAQPSIGVDEMGAARTAAGIGAAMATGGLSVVGEWVMDKVTGETPPCLAAQGKSASGKKSKGGFLDGLLGR